MADDPKEKMGAGEIAMTAVGVAVVAPALICGALGALVLAPLAIPFIIATAANRD